MRTIRRFKGTHILAFHAKTMNIASMSGALMSGAAVTTSRIVGVFQGIFIDRIFLGYAARVNDRTCSGHYCNANEDQKCFQGAVPKGLTPIIPLCAAAFGVIVRAVRLYVKTAPNGDYGADKQKSKRQDFQYTYHSIHLGFGFSLFKSFTARTFRDRAAVTSKFYPMETCVC